MGKRADYLAEYKQALAEIEGQLNKAIEIATRVQLWRQSLRGAETDGALHAARRGVRHELQTFNERRQT